MQKIKYWKYQRKTNNPYGLCVFFGTQKIKKTLGIQREFFFKTNLVFWNNWQCSWVNSWSDAYLPGGSVSNVLPACFGLRTSASWGSSRLQSQKNQGISDTQADVESTYKSLAVLIVPSQQDLFTGTHLTGLRHPFHKLWVHKAGFHHMSMCTFSYKITLLTPTWTDTQWKMGSVRENRFFNNFVFMN